MSTKIHFKLILPLLIIPLIFVSIWFKNGLITGGGDEALLFYNPRSMLKLSSQTWVEAGTGMPVLYWLSRTNFLYLVSIIHEKLLIPTYVLEAGSFYVLMLIGVISVYFITYRFLNKLNNGYLISLISAIFYLLNPFSISQVWARGLFAQYFSFALFPLSILIFIIGLQKRKLILALILALSTYFLSTAFGVVTIIPTLWFVLLIYLLYWIKISKQKTKDVLFGTSFLVLSFVFWLLVSAWWLLPLVITGNKVLISYLSNANENLGTLMGVSRNFTPDIIIRLLQRSYFFDAGFNPKVYSMFIFQLISLISPIFLIIGLVLIFKRRVLREFNFFLIVFSVGLLVSLGANPPFGWFFVWVFKHSSFLQAFRNPYEKFGLVYSLGYSPLFAFGLVYFFRQVFKENKVRLFGIVTTLVLICGIFAWPMWIGRVMAGPDRHIGLPVPSDYGDLQKWLDKNGADYRVFMTPFWGGEGAFYNWSGTRYQGVDPMVFMLSQPAISAGFQIPFYYDFVLNIRRYMERINLAPSLALLRAKYLINREDAIMLTESEKLHQKFLTDTIYPPIGSEFINQSICQNQSANSLQSGTAWVVCRLSATEGDWSKIKYLHLRVKTFTPAFLEIAVRDKKEIRIRWDGRSVSEYRTDTNDWTEIILPLSAPSEYNSDMDFSAVSMVEVFAHPKDNQQASVYEVSVKDIKLDPGKEEKIGEFQLVNTFGQLQVYEPLHLIAPPEFGILSSVFEVSDFPQLFKEAFKNREIIDKNGFTLLSQNTNKNLLNINQENSSRIQEKAKISDTKYWLKLNEASGSALLLLSKNFNPEWKVIPDISQEQLDGEFFNNLEILKRAVLPEDNHYIVNGYANLWQVDGKKSQYAIVFMPQLIAELGARISLFAILGLAGLIAVWLFKQLINEIH